MKKVAEFLRSTIVTGALVILPVLLIALLLIEAVQMVLFIATPIAALLPIEQVGGIDLAKILALLLIVVTLVVVGLIARSGPGDRAGRWFERRLLLPVPGYSMLKTLTTGIGKVDSAQLRPVMVEIAPGIEEIGFLTEEHAEGATVFFPLAPTPTVGSVRFVRAERMRALDVPTGVALNSVMRWGLDSKDIHAAKSS